MKDKAKAAKEYLKANWKPLLVGAATGAAASQGIPPEQTHAVLNALLNLLGAS